MGKINCWEFNKCGREHTCPSGILKKYNGVNGGTNGGRLCWSVSGNFCEKKDLKNRNYCLTCPFYDLVKKEEGLKFQFLSLCDDHDKRK